MYICEDCGNEFDEPITYKEPRGEFWGEPAFETMCGCPFCKGAFYEVEENEDKEE